MATQALPAALASGRAADAAFGEMQHGRSFTRARRIFDWIVAAQTRRAERHVALYCASRPQPAGHAATREIADDSHACRTRAVLLQHAPPTHIKKGTFMLPTLIHLHRADSPRARQGQPRHVDPGRRCTRRRRNSAAHCGESIRTPRTEPRGVAPLPADDGAPPATGAAVLNCRLRLSRQEVTPWRKDSSATTQGEEEAEGRFQRDQVGVRLQAQGLGSST